jgi:transcriptional regulator with XRE-family HTH domain
LVISDDYRPAFEKSNRPAFDIFGQNAAMIYEPLKIKELRRLKKWSQQELARRAKLSQPTISALEAGEEHVKHSTLVAVVNALGVPLREVMKRPSKADEADQIDQAIALANALEPKVRAAWIAAGNALLNSEKE